MATLKNRNQQIPGGFKFYQAETSWNAPDWRSFETIVLALIDHRKGNPYATKKHGWRSDYEGVAAEVDAYNAKLCQANGWSDFIIEASPDPPKLPPQHWAGAGVVGHVKRSAAGIKLVMDWLGSGLKPVPAELSEKRAAICAVCPMNAAPSLLQKLEGMAVENVKLLIEVKNDMTLRTSFDAKLLTCQACDCKNELKVHAPLEHILANTSEEVKGKLHESCWILKRDAV
jgi:hypothetical protein